jgi:hypothetical protein
MALHPKPSQPIQPIQPFSSGQAESEFNTAVNDFFHHISKVTTLTPKDLDRLIPRNLTTLLALTNLQCALHKIEETEANFNPRRPKSWLKTVHHNFFPLDEKMLLSTRRQTLACMESFFSELELMSRGEGGSVQGFERGWGITMLASEVINNSEWMRSLKNAIDRLDPFLIAKVIGEIKWRKVEL